MSGRIEPAPPPASVRMNRWPDIDVPAIGEWRPSRRVSLILPYYDAQDELDKTLAALTRQTYPRDLMEVIVADDGSPTPPSIPDVAAPLDVVVRSQEDLGFGLARARNLGARAATGEILIFIDCDMIPERQHVEAHARWHHAVSDALVFGFRWHADFSGFDAATIGESVAAGTVRDLVADQDPDYPEWIEGHLERTEMLTGPFDDLFLVTSGGNLSIRRDFYWDIGGNDESFDQWGGEDNEFGYRAFQAGAIIAPERDAVCWHQGEGHEPSPEEARSHHMQKPKMRNLIAELAFRQPQPGRSYTRPYVVASVDARESPAELTAATVSSVLGSDFHDLVVVVDLGESGDDAEWLTREYASDPRVLFSSASASQGDIFRWSPVQVGVPAGALLHRGTLSLIVDRLGATGVGAIYVTIPGIESSQALIRGVTTRAMNRAQRNVARADEIDGWIGKSFGEWWESGTWFGVGTAEQPPGTGTLDPRLLTGGPDRSDEIEALQARLADLHGRRALRIANAMGSVARARSIVQLSDALRSFRSPTRP